MQHYEELMLSIAGEKDIEGASLLNAAALSGHDSGEVVLLAADLTANEEASRSGINASGQGGSACLDLKRLRKRSLALSSDVTSTFTKPLSSSGCYESRPTGASDMDVIMRRFEQLISDMQSSCSVIEGGVASSSLSLSSGDLASRAGSMVQQPAEPRSSDAEISSSHLTSSCSSMYGVETRGILESR